MKIRADKILLLIRDNEISSLVEELCFNISNQIDTASSCIDGVAYACENSWDLLILYTSDHYSFIPGVCKQIKLRKPCSQIIVISGNVDPTFISDCIHQGADDYIAIPWNNTEFVARVRSCIRRFQLQSQLLEGSNSTVARELPNSTVIGPAINEPATNGMPLSDDSHYLKIGDISLCPFKREVCVLDSKLKLTRTEYLLLIYLMERIDRPCSSVELLNNVLGYENENYLPSLHSHVSRLRRKINISRTTTIETIWCYGYRVLTKQSAALQ